MGLRCREVDRRTLELHIEAKFLDCRKRGTEHLRGGSIATQPVGALLACAGGA